MRLKLLPGLLLSAGLLVSSIASGAVVWSGTLVDWAGEAGGTGVIVDADHDMRFTLFSTTTTIPAAGTFVTISETEIAGVDYYDVGVAWESGWGGGGQLVYTMESINTPEKLRAAAWDTTIIGQGTAALLDLHDLSTGTPFIFANLSSFDGAHDPVTGYASFAPRSLIGVVEVFQPSTGGEFKDAHASFAVSEVPEPATLALAGLAIGGLATSRRRRLEAQPAVGLQRREAALT